MYEVKRRKPGRHWFVLLTCLLLLSLAAPMLWNNGLVRLRDDSRAPAPQNAELASRSPAIATPDSQPHIIFAATTEGDLDEPDMSLPEPESPPLADEFLGPDYITTIPPLATEVISEPLVANQASTLVSEVIVTTEIPKVESPLLPRFHGTTQRRLDAGDQLDMTTDSAPTMSRPDAWPLPMVLLAQLDALSHDAEAASWAFRVIDLLEQLGQAPLIDNIATDQIIGRLQETISEANKLVEIITTPETQGEMRRAAYATRRRIATCRLANNVFTQDVLAAVDNVFPRHDRLAMLDLDVPGVSPLPLSPTRPLPHIGSQPLIIEAEPYQHDLAPPLVPFALNGTARVRNLLGDLERYEATRTLSDSRRVARHIVDLAASSDVARRELAKHLDEHYRNANIRITVRDDLINELLPEPEKQESEVDEYVAGVPVWGWQETVAKLNTKLIEHPSELRIRVNAVGTVSSDTHASQGPATLRSAGQTDYVVGQTVVVSQRGLGLTRVTSSADAHSSLTDVETDYQGVPLVGAVVENVARRRYDEEKGAALGEVEDRVAQQARQRFEKEFTPEIVKAARGFHKYVWTPLQGLDLDPTAVEMRTTAERLNIRYLIGGTDLLAAHTARPRAPSDSLASMQIHETLLNNALGQFDLDGKTFTLPELHHHVSSRLHYQETKEVPQDFDKRVKISFAKQDAVRVRCENGVVELTLSLDSISRGKKYHWEDLVVKARYQPAGTGLEARLERKDSIELIGKDLKTRDQIALRGVFSKMLSKSRYASLVPEKLASHPALKKVEVIQFDINDGWVGVAIGPRLPMQAEEQDEATARLPRWRLSRKKDRKSRR